MVSGASMRKHEANCHKAQWDDVLCVFLLHVRLFQIHAIRLSPRMRSPALPILPAFGITASGRCRFVQSCPVSCLPQRYPAL
ncbi:hypothetical protein D4764_05G0006970 [Takifugu flavidus]|uniref:Uncharacterized protein n=1 Tax=Takifugu flavidus TaxID=433684 RepID=A0A5C6N4E4_9TELE|nr:hypothetical protein D4764_05G0006970 [Takifugu flavidus]